MSENEPAPLPEIDATTALAWMQAREAILLDVREANEFEYENVPGSVLLPLSFLDPDTFPPITDKKVIVLCAIGKRAAAAQKQLAASGLPNIFNLTGGLDSLEEGRVRNPGRQVRSARLLDLMDVPRAAGVAATATFIRRPVGAGYPDGP